jgi:hypothetical protein
MMCSAAPLLDYLEGVKRRDEGMRIVAANNEEWLRLALIELEQMSRSSSDWENMEHGFIGEDIRNMLIPRIGRPTTPHCYGAMIRIALQRGLIEETGKLRAMKDVNSHARRSMVYRWTVQAA